jgi:hypothetical protein
MHNTMRRKASRHWGVSLAPRVTPHPAAAASQEVRLPGQLEHVDVERRLWGRGDKHLISLLHRPLDRGPLLSLGAGSRCKLSLLQRTRVEASRVILSSGRLAPRDKDTTKAAYRIRSGGQDGRTALLPRHGFLPSWPGLSCKA